MKEFIKNYIMSKYHFKLTEQLDMFLLKHNYSDKGKRVFECLDVFKNKWRYYDGSKEYIGEFYPTYNKFKKDNFKNTFSYKGQLGYVGCVSLLDGEIEEIVSVGNVVSNYSHHCKFLSYSQYEKVESGENALFIVLNKKVMPYYLCKVPSDILAKITNQIAIL